MEDFPYVEKGTAPRHTLKFNAHWLNALGHWHHSVLHPPCQVEWRTSNVKSVKILSLHSLSFIPIYRTGHNVPQSSLRFPFQILLPLHLLFFFFYSFAMIWIDTINLAFLFFQSSCDFCIWLYCILNCLFYFSVTLWVKTCSLPLHSSFLKIFF